MADTTETLILDIQFDTEQATKNSLELNKTLAALKETQKELKKSGNELSEEYIQNAVEIKRVTAEARSNEQALLKQAQANKAASGSNDQLRSTLSVLTRQYNALSQEQRDGSVAGQVLQKSIKNISDTLKGTEGSVGDFRRNVGDYEGAVERAANSISGLRERLAELDNIIQNTDIGSQRFKDASDEAANLRLSIDQATGKVDEFGNREPKNPIKKNFEDAVVTAGLLGSTFTALSAKFEDNEAAQEKLATAAQGVAIAINIANVVKEKGAIIDTATLIKTQALTAAQATLAVVVGTSTGAMKLFRIALAATGIGLLILGIGLLIENFDKVKEALFKFIPGLKELAEFVSEAADKFLKFIGVTDDETKSLKDQETQVQKLIKAETRRLDQAKQNFSQRKRLLEAAGKDTTALQIQEEKFFKDQALRQIKFIESQLTTIQRFSKSAFEGAKAEIIRLTDEVANRTVEAEALQIEAAREAADKAKELRDKRLQEEAEALAKRAEFAKKITELELQEAEEASKLTQKRTEEEKKASDERIKIAQDALSALTVTTQEQLEQQTLLRFTAAQKNIDIAALENEGILIKNQESVLALAELETTSGLARQQIVDDYFRFVEEQGDISFEKYLELMQKQVDATNAAYLNQVQAAASFGQAVGDIFAQSVTETGFELENFAKGFTTLILDTLQKVINAAIVESTAKSFAQTDSVASFGASGAIRAGILAGLINGAFAVVKSKINKPVKAFATGVIGLQGEGTETSDSIPAYLSRGESVIPAWGTRAMMRDFPGLLERYVGAPRFADGVVNFQPTLLPQSDNNSAILDAIRNMPTPVVRVVDINKGQQNYAEVRSTGTI
jgi:hypothetical protein